MPLHGLPPLVLFGKIADGPSVFAKDARTESERRAKGEGKESERRLKGEEKESKRRREGERGEGERKESERRGEWGVKGGRKGNKRRAEGGKRRKGERGLTDKNSMTASPRNDPKPGLDMPWEFRNSRAPPPGAAGAGGGGGGGFCVLLNLALFFSLRRWLSPLRFNLLSSRRGHVLSSPDE
jgi:hypothetical protein